jgi:hypothetical protein
MPIPRRGSHAPAPVISARRAPKYCHPDAPLPWVLIERIAIERFTSIRPRACWRGALVRWPDEFRRRRFQSITTSAARGGVSLVFGFHRSFTTSISRLPSWNALNSSALILGDSSCEPVPFHGTFIAHSGWNNRAHNRQTSRWRVRGEMLQVARWTPGGQTLRHHRRLALKRQ